MPMLCGDHLCTARQPTGVDVGKTRDICQRRPTRSCSCGSGMRPHGQHWPAPAIGQLWRVRPCCGGCHSLGMTGQRLTWRTSGPCFREGKDLCVLVCACWDSRGMAGCACALTCHWSYMCVETCDATAPVSGCQFVVHAAVRCACAPADHLVRLLLCPMRGLQ
jgi:hypothetical protein